MLLAAICLAIRLLPATLRVGGLWVCLSMVGAAGAAEPASDLFAPPAPAQADEIYLVSTRPAGTSCDGERLDQKLECHRYEIDAQGQARWKSLAWREALTGPSSLRTVIYVHGNRVEPGEDRARGLDVYRSLVEQGKPSAPIRYIIWSWPATTIPGPLKDVQVKAARTRPAGWQLAWFLDQLPEEASVSLVGYSYGARVISGALHLLGGGSLGSLQLTHRVHPQRPPFRVAMIAAAYDADWIQPGGYHQQMISQVEQLTLLTNHRDPAMRLYHFSIERAHVDALGKAGVPRPASLGGAAQRVAAIEVSAEVGRSHLLVDYLAARGKMALMWRHVLVEPAAQFAAQRTPDAVSAN